MPDTDTLRGYRVGDAGSLPDSDRLYLAKELKRISQSIGQLIEVVKKLDARLVAGGL